VIVPRIHDIISPDVEPAVSSWRPADPSHVYLPLEMTIGGEDAVGTALFQVVVATPEALRSRAEAGKRSVISERALLVVSEFDWRLVRRALDDIVFRCRGWSWPEVEERLRRYFRHEYEDQR
jgi:hypothetical protein